MGFVIVMPAVQRPTVARTRWATYVRGNGVVEVAGLRRMGARGEATRSITGVDVLDEIGWRGVPSSAVFEQGAGGRGGEQPPPGSVGGEPPRGLGGDRPVAVQVSRLVVDAMRVLIGTVTPTAAARPRRAPNGWWTCSQAALQQPRCPSSRADQHSSARVSARSWSSVRGSSGWSVWARRAAASMAVQNAAK
jgi:hypothetical protein